MPVPVRPAVGLTAAGILSLAAALAPPAVLAQTAEPSPAAGSSATVPAPTPGRLSVVATYPSVVVEPGSEGRFDLLVTGPSHERVDLAVDGVPQGWDATFRGGDAVVTSVAAGGDEPPDLQLRVSVPEDAVAQDHRLTVRATAESGIVDLPLDVSVAAARGGSVSLTTDYPALQGDSSETFSFDLKLANDTSQDIDFVLQTQVPDGWQAEARPTGQELAATTLVAAGDSERIKVTVTPARRADAGDYPVLVTATGGDHTAEAPLGVRITGSYAMSLTSADGRLNTTASAGASSGFTIAVTNDGTAPLSDVALTARAPNGWKVTFDPATLPLVAPGESATATAAIVPAGDAVAGDYVVTMTARNDRVDESVDVRVTVETSTTWGIVAVGIIVLVIVVLALVFRRFGRR